MVYSRKLFAVVLIVGLLATTPIATTQTRRNVTSEVLERNVRAQMNFLAGDAMQGRGSGTNYERLAAEYIGSMFQQFGLEPGGDADSSGGRIFIQSVALQTARFATPPVLTTGSGTDARSWQYSRDFLVNGMRVPRISGNLQIIKGEEVATKGAITVIQLPEQTTAQQRQDRIRAARTAQAAAILLLETDTNRRQRESGVRVLSMPARAAGEAESSNTPALVSLRKDVFEEFLKLPEGVQIELSGDLQTETSATAWNAVGILRGADSVASKEAIILSAHLDHLGTNASATGDNIFNGADDNASGCVAVIELARVLASGRRPKRSIVFVGFGGEERGAHGSRYFIQNSPFPLDKIVANLNFEMLGRPDPKVGPDTLWLTGFERSTLGPELAKRGARIVADPHPEQNFFQRSDNYSLAVRGVVAHTVSSFGLHRDYHRVTDELAKIDFPYMTRSINSLVGPIRWLASSRVRPEWLAGKQPSRN